MAGIGWSNGHELKRDALYNKVESVIIRVMNNPDGGSEIFEKMTAELREFVRAESKRHAIIEDRVTRSEEGKARTLAAKSAVQTLINQKASGLKLPLEVGRFLSDTWSRMLVFVWTRDGEDSDTWVRSVEILDELLWVVQPLASRDDLARREELIEPLLARIEGGMTLLGIGTAEVQQRSASLRAAIELVVRNDLACREDDAEPQPVAGAKELERLVLAVVEEQPEPADTRAEALRAIRHLQVGTWVELVDDRGEILRCKIASIVQPGDRFLFVNRRGMKVAERTPGVLAGELHDGSLNVLDDAQVFDRALQAVVGNLRQMHRSPTPVG
jgi:hypothetical protein